MKSFQGSTISKLDSSGRLKLPPNVVADFKGVDATGKVVLKLQPEGAIAILPANVFGPTSSPDASAQDYLGSAAARIRLRREMLFVVSDEISQQGRLTLPASFIKRIGVAAGDDVAIIGISFGYEIWKPETLEAEMDEELEQGRRLYDQAREQLTE